MQQTQVYKPFQYPPDFKLALCHKDASMPGRAKRGAEQCPCCNQKPKAAFKSWWSRSIDEDFKDYGGAVVTYFWLLKFYIIVCLSIIIIYSVYLIYCTQDYCQNNDQCVTLFGTKVVSNEKLWHIIKDRGDDDVLIRLFTLRAVSFVILLVANAFSLYIVARFKKRYPAKTNISAYSLLFKNVRINSDEFILKLKQEFSSIDIKQLFLVKRLEPYNTLTNNRMKLYYECLNCQNDKQFKKLMKKLQRLDKECDQAQKQFNITGDRMILVLNSIETKREIMQKYHVGFLQRMRQFICTKQSQRLFCENCPPPAQILWNNFGTVQDQKMKSKIFSFVYFLILIGGSYLIIAGCLHIVYNSIFAEPWNTVLVNVILIGVVVIALTFRAFMNKLSQMRHPNTQTHRTMFIVLTTISFHFLYYIIIPTFYFYMAQDVQKSEILKLVSNQTLNFIIVQVVIMAFDCFHCCWSKGLKHVQNEQKPIGCQKILHQRISYPRFPIQFKLIILFKFWSYSIFFAFQVPLIFILLLFGLLFIFIKDKQVAYTHYRMEIIYNDVQFTFLKIYSNFFSLYMLLIFIFTQHTQIDNFISIPMTFIAMACQTFLIKNPNTFQDHQIKLKMARDQERQGIEPNNMLLPLSLDQLDTKQEKYKQLYLKFVEQIDSGVINQKIKGFILSNGSQRSLFTEQASANRSKKEYSSHQ